MNKNESIKKNAQQFNINYKRQSVKGAVACLIGRCVRFISCVTFVTFVALCTLRALDESMV